MVPDLTARLGIETRFVQHEAQRDLPWNLALPLEAGGIDPADDRGVAGVHVVLVQVPGGRQLRVRQTGQERIRFLRRPRGALFAHSSTRENGRYPLAVLFRGP